MIQRIQTIYLLLIAGIMLAILFLPLGYIQNPDGVYMFDTQGVHSMGDKPQLVTPWTLYVLPACSAFLAILTIFFYKRRKLQVNMCFLLLFSIVLFYVFLLMYTWTPNEGYAAHITFSVAMVFPIVSLILGILAIGGIKKDEKLVRSLDRIR